MKPDALLLKLHALGIRLAFTDDAIDWRGPKDTMTPALLAELKAHKPLLVTIARTIGDEHNRDWDIVREWALDHSRPTVTRDVAAAGRRVGIPYTDDYWPEPYARRILQALQVRAVLRILEHAATHHGDPVTLSTESAERELIHG